MNLQLVGTPLSQSFTANVVERHHTKIYHPMELPPIEHEDYHCHGRIEHSIELQYHSPGRSLRITFPDGSLAPDWRISPIIEVNSTPNVNATARFSRSFKNGGDIIISFVPFSGSLRLDVSYGITGGIYRFNNFLGYHEIYWSTSLNLPVQELLVSVIFKKYLDKTHDTSVTVYPEESIVRNEEGMIELQEIHLIEGEHVTVIAGFPMDYDNRGNCPAVSHPKSLVFFLTILIAVIAGINIICIFLHIFGALIYFYFNDLYDWQFKKNKMSQKGFSMESSHLEQELNSTEDQRYRSKPEPLQPELPIHFFSGPVCFCVVIVSMIVETLSFIFPNISIFMWTVRITYLLVPVSFIYNFLGSSMSFPQSHKMLGKGELKQFYESYRRNKKPTQDHKDVTDTPDEMEEFIQLNETMRSSGSFIQNLRNPPIVVMKFSAKIMNEPSEEIPTTETNDVYLPLETQFVQVRGLSILARYLFARGSYVISSLFFFGWFHNLLATKMKVTYTVVVCYTNKRTPTVSMEPYSH